MGCKKVWIKVFGEKSAPKKTTCEMVILFFAEFFGTAIMVFIGCTGLCSEKSTLLAGISFGCAVLTVVQIFSHISLSHVNPAVTLAGVILGHLRIELLPIYWVAQCLGATTGAFIMVSLSADFYSRTWCISHIGPGISLVQAVFSEIILTAILCMAYAAALDARHASHHDSIAVRFGLIVTGLAMSGHVFSSSSLNPARSLGPAIVHNVWLNHWVYWLGPLVGSFLASVLYRVVFRDRTETKRSLGFTTD